MSGSLNNRGSGVAVIRPPRMPLLADSTLGRIALGQGHALEALALAGALALAAVVRGLAIVLALAAVDAITVHLGFFGHGHGAGQAGEQGSGGKCQGGTGSSSLGSHGVILDWSGSAGRRRFLRAGIQLERGLGLALQGRPRFLLGTRRLKLVDSRGPPYR